jgi:hypothetical protein
MKPRDIFLTILAITLTFLFCARPGGPWSVLAAGKPLTVNHTLKLKHKHDTQNGHDVTWEIKENGKGAFRLTVKPGQTIQWTNMNGMETNMSIIVNNTQDWSIAEGAFKTPTYGPGCATCGQIEPENGVIQLTFKGMSGTTNYHYQIVVPNPKGPHIRVPYDYDYDMVDATVVWDETLQGEEGKARRKP